VHMPTTMSTALAEKTESTLEDTAAEKPLAPVSISTFQQLVDFVGTRRDIKLKGELERHVRPVKVAPGQLEIALEASAPRGLPGELGRKLEAWTGMRWIVSLSQEAGETPLHQQRRERKDSLFAKAREHPDVRAVLDAFPGAEIVDVGNNDVPDPQPDVDIDGTLDDN